MEKRQGRQTPTKSYVLPYTKTLGPEAIKLYNSARPDTKAMPWQELLIYDILAVNRDGHWVHLKYGYSVSRRNGKSEDGVIRCLFGIKHDEHILYTAHRSDTARAIWERVCDFANALHFRFKTYSSFGREGIEWCDPDATGEEKARKHFKIDFRTRNSSGAGLGSGYDTLIIDEAQEYTTEQESSLKYVVSASENPQTIYFGTPPTVVSHGNTFPQMRHAILSGEMQDAGWSEWSVDAMHDPQDIDAWYETNPSLGFRLQERIIRSEITTDKTDFNVQRLGLWLNYNQNTCITPADWEIGMVDKLPAISGKLYVGIKYGFDGANVSVCIAAKLRSGDIFTEALDCRPIRAGNEWILHFLKNADVKKAIVDGNGAQTLVEQCGVIRFKHVMIPKAAEVVQANNDFEQAVFSGQMKHMDQDSLDRVATNCEHRAIGSNGGFGYRTLSAGRDISLVEADALAFWLCKSDKRVKQIIHY